MPERGTTTLPGTTPLLISPPKKASARPHDPALPPRPAQTLSTRGPSRRAPDPWPPGYARPARGKDTRLLRHTRPDSPAGTSRSAAIVARMPRRDERARSISLCAQVCKFALMIAVSCRARPSAPLEHPPGYSSCPTQRCTPVRRTRQRAAPPPAPHPLSCIECRARASPTAASAPTQAVTFDRPGHPSFPAPPPRGRELM